MIHFCYYYKLYWFMLVNWLYHWSDYVYCFVILQFYLIILLHVSNKFFRKQSKCFDQIHVWCSGPTDNRSDGKELGHYYYSQEMLKDTRGQYFFFISLSLNFHPLFHKFLTFCFPLCFTSKSKQTFSLCFLFKPAHVTLFKC